MQCERGLTRPKMLMILYQHFDVYTSMSQKSITIYADTSFSKHYVQNYSILIFRRATTLANQPNQTSRKPIPIMDNPKVSIYLNGLQLVDFPWLSGYSLDGHRPKQANQLVESGQYHNFYPLALPENKLYINYMYHYISGWWFQPL